MRQLRELADPPSDLDELSAEEIVEACADNPFSNWWCWPDAPNEPIDP
jgi:hypothetical protein